MSAIEHVTTAKASHWRKSSRRLACGLVGLMVLAALPSQAQEAGQRVHRCVGRNGEVLFSGLPCNEEAAAAGKLGGTAGDPPAADACATSAEQLRETVARAVARHDANTIAGAMRWRGIGGHEAKQRLAELRALVHEPLLSIDGGNGGFVVKTGSHLDRGVRSIAFDVTAEGGCYWLDW